MVIVDHPLGGISDADLAQRIDAAYEQTVALLESAGTDVSAQPGTSSDGSGNGSANGSSNGSRSGVTGTVPAAEPVGQSSAGHDAVPDPGVDAALEELRSALASDGAGLAVASADDQNIAVELTFTDETCMDCIIPPPTLEAIISDTLKRSGYEQAISVSDPRI